MDNRKVRLALAAAVGALATMPFTSAASAMYCEPPVVSTVCWAWGQACQFVPHGDKIDPNALACTSVA